jgi:hypothetical protein
MLDAIRLILLTIYAIATMSFESAITIILAALAALLTALAIIIGLGAIWGWAGIKEAASKAATDAMNRRMKEYPEPERMLELMSRMEEVLGSWESIQNQLVTGFAAEPVATASNAGVQQETTVAPPYPGQEVKNVSPTSSSTAGNVSSNTADTDADPG